MSDGNAPGTHLPGTDPEGRRLFVCAFPRRLWRHIEARATTTDEINDWIVTAVASAILAEREWLGYNPGPPNP